MALVWIKPLINIIALKAGISRCFYISDEDSSVCFALAEKRFGQSIEIWDAARIIGIHRSSTVNAKYSFFPNQLLLSLTNFLCSKKPEGVMIPTHLKVQSCFHNNIKPLPSHPPPIFTLTFSSRCWQSKNDLSRTQRWIWWTHYENWVVTVVRRIDDQLWSFFRSATLVRAVTTVGRIVPNMFSTGPRGLNWGQTSAAGYFFYPNFIMVMIIIIRVTVLTSWRPSQRPAISLTVFTMQTGIKGLSSKNWILEMIKIFSSHYGKY